MTPDNLEHRLLRSRRQQRRLAAAAAVIATLGFLASPLEASDRDTVRRLLEDGRYAEARQVAAADLERVRAAEGNETLAAAQALDLWIEARLADGDSSLELLELAEQTMEMNEKLLGAEDLRLAESLSNVALARIAIRGDRAAARVGYERALFLRRKHLGEDHPDTLRETVRLTNLLRDMGEYEEARALLERAIIVAESTFGPESLEISRLLSTRGILLWRLDELREARPDLERAVRIQERLLGTHPEFALTLNRLAILEWAEGDYVAARALYERQLDIQQRTLRPDHPDFGTTWLNMGLLLWRTGDLQGAKGMFDLSLTLPAHRENPDHPGRNYQNYARLALEMGDYAGARAQLEKLKEVRERLLQPNDPMILSTYWDLGTLHRETGELELARDYLQLALSRSAVVHGSEHTRSAEILRDLALLEERSGDLAAARRHLERAIGIVETAVGRSSPLTATMLGDLGRILLRQGRTSAALDLSLEAAGLHRTHLTRVARYFSEREALSAEAHRLAAIQTACSVVARAGVGSEVAARLWDEVTRARALVLDAIAARHRVALDMEDSAAGALRDDLEGARRRLARLFGRGPGDGDVEGHMRQLRAAGDEKERLERRLAATGAAGDDGATGREAGLDEVRASLPRGAALVAFLEFDDFGATRSRDTGPTAASDSRPRRFYLGLVLAPEPNGLSVVRLADAGTLEGAVDAWRTEVAARPRSDADIARYLESGRRLRAIAWDPIAARLGAAEEVYLVPDGALNLVSFATLPGDGDGYLVERLRFHYLSAERDLVPPAPPEAPGRGLLVLGGADFDADPAAPAAAVARTPPLSELVPQPEIFRGIHSACGDFASLRFAPLPGSEAEARELAVLFSSRDPTPATFDAEPVTLLTGPAATEGALKRSARGHRILHLATHGFVIDSACDSALPRPGTRAAAGAMIASSGASDPTGGALPVTRTVIENPLLLSGIALTSVNRRDQAGPDQEDGVLTAEEAASLDLRGVQWAVLSGCGTGLGPVQTGEGVLGLRRAFRVAGAETLILSLWPVEDHAARQWFRHLYEARLAGDPTPVAMQRASLEVLERRRAAGTTTHPFFWGAFVAAGDWK